jgi:hypothetical protein
LTPTAQSGPAHLYRAPLEGEQSALTGQDEQEQPRKLVGVVPSHAAEERRTFFDALEQAFPVRFQGREQNDLHGLDGVLAFGVQPTAQDPERRSAGVSDSAALPVAPPCPCLIVCAQSAGPARAVLTVELTEDRSLMGALRGRRLSEECAPSSSLPGPKDHLPGPSEGDRVLALADGRPVWWRRAGNSRWLQYSSYCPEDLGEGEALRDQLRAGHFMGLAPLLHLLHRVCSELAWERQPLRAAFVIDDPNLHHSSYGYLSYRELIAHADRHGYHLALATVPLDGWMFSRRAGALVGGHPRALSLLMHGNDHLSGELGRLLDDRTAQSALAQALRRTSALERRCGVAIERVMVPPHELCSTMALAAMFRLGFEGACIGRRHPWQDPRSLSTLLPARLLKWHPTDLIDGGLPVIPRHPIEQSREDLVFRALLRQPLILFAHHGDFADGLDSLAQAASEINGLGEVRWGSVGSIARDCFFSRRVGQTLHVQLHSRKAVLEIPPEVSALRVSVPSLIASEPQRWLLCGSAPVALRRGVGSWTSKTLPVASGERVELALVAGDPLDPASVPAPPRRPWPLARRLLVESRDRVRPLIAR